MTAGAAVPSLADFIEARLVDKEARARSLLKAARTAREIVADPKSLGKLMPGWDSWPEVEAMCEQALREVAAHRAILAEHCTWTDRYGPDPILAVSQQNCIGCGFDSVEEPQSPTLEDCPTLRALAAIWSDHADFLPEWTPEAVST